MVYIDFESRSECDLTVHGAYNYARDPSTRVLCMAWAIDDGEVEIWAPGQEFPKVVADAVAKGDTIMAHNAAFERLIWSYVLGPDHGVPVPKLEQFYCTAAQARANCAPGSLEDVGRFAGAAMKKDHKGAALVRKCCCPPFKHTEQDLADLFAYCAQDVRAMRAVSQAMRPLSAQELADYHTNERVNDRGVLVDVALAKAAQTYVIEELDAIQQEVRELTDGAITSVRSPRMREWVWDRVGPQARKLMTKDEKPSIDKSVRAALLILAEENKDEVPTHVADVVQCADDLWASSVAKFKRMADLADVEDHRVRGAFVFAGGAATGRASSYGLQVHNFARKTADDPAAVRHAMVRGHQIVPTYGKRVTDVLKGMLRPALIPEPGKVFVVADWSAIEGRVNPWLANNHASAAKLDAFARGLDAYIVNAAATFGRRYEDIFAGYKAEDAEATGQRQIGKVQELACLSEDTLVLTICGEKAIQDVRPGDLVWDGLSWVCTDGAIYRGEKDVIEYDGLCATADHLVWVEGQANPVEFGAAAGHGLRLVRARAPHKTDVSVAGEKVVGSQTTLREPEIAGIQNVWGAWNYFPVSNSSECLCVGFGEHRGASIEYGTGPHRQLERLRAGQLEMVNEGAEQKAHCEDRQHPCNAQVSTAAPRSTVRGQYDEEFAVDGAYFRANSRQVEPPKLQAKRRVWDLLNCGPFHRFTASGRLVHNCGFAGGVGAFASMGRNYGLTMPEPEAKRMVNAWRRANPWAVAFWSDLERAYTAAMRRKGQEFSAGRVTYFFDGLHLWYALPSGRILCYPYARLDADGISYAKAAWKPAADAKEWPRARLWPGLACENVVQATAHCLLREALRQLPEAVLHVHDEAVCETDDAERTTELMKRVMQSPPAWAAGLPLDIGIKTMERYSK